jgi:hypothetical protein
MYVICFAKISENHAKLFAFRFHFVWSENKNLSEKGHPSVAHSPSVISTIMDQKHR